MLRVDNHREIKALGIGPRETRVSVGAPLHRRAHAVAIAEINIIAHADFIAVIDHRRSGKREKQAMEQLHLAPIIAQQRREPAADAEIDARARIVGVNFIHVIPVFIRDHFQCQLVMIAEE